MNDSGPAKLTGDEPTREGADVAGFSLNEDVLCPRCEYMLRGLSEARCPECGLRFEWSEIREGSVRHPWLFDQSANVGVRSFLAPLVRSLVPTHFWRSVRLTNRPGRSRIVVFYFWCLLLIPAFILVPALGTMLTEQIAENRQSNAAWLQRLAARPPIPGSEFEARVQEEGGAQAIADSMFPTGILANVELLAQQSRIDWEVVWVMLLFVAAWPWVSYGPIFIFQSSLVKSKPGRWHVLRCAMYPFSLFVVGAIGIGAITLMGVLDVVGARESALLATIIAIVTVLYYSYSYLMALTHYLKINRPIATGLLSQFVAACLLITIMLSIVLNAGW